MKYSVLVVEDERDIADLMSIHLKREGHQVTIFENGEDALKALEEGREFDMMVLDWMLPGVSGLEICKKIRSDKAIHNLPILMVTARAHASDIVVGLEMGADDYLTKPFEIPIFVARVRALIRRANLEKNQEWYSVGELHVDINTYQVVCAGESVVLTPSEFKLLVAMLRNQGRVLTRDKLIDMVQGEGISVIDRAVDTHIFGLRKKLGKCSDLVETVRGIGYRIRV